MQITMMRGRTFRALVALLALAGALPIENAVSMERLAPVANGIGRGSDNMGSTVALFGDTAAAGAPGTQIVPNVPAGAVDIYRWQNGAWQSEAMIPPNPGAGTAFGTAVALGQDLLVVGSAQALNTFERDGSGWHPVDAMPTVSLSSQIGLSGDTLAAMGTIYMRSGSGWSPQATLEADNLENFRNMAIDGDLAVGVTDAYSLIAPPHAIYFYSRSGSEWTREARVQLHSSYEAVQVAISGNTVLVSSSDSDIATTVNVRVFERDDSGNWTDQGTLDTGSLPYEAAVSIDGDRAVVGSHGDYTASTFERTNGVWHRVQHFNDPSSRCFEAVALSGTRLLAGCPTSYAADVGYGVADFFALDQTPPPVVARFGQGDARAGLQFGAKVAGGVDTLIADALDGVHFFAASGSGWTETALFPPLNGIAASMSLDGDIAALGYPDGIDTIAIYERVAGAWALQAMIPGPPDESIGVSIAVGGNALVAGELDYDGASAFLGTCHTWTRSGATWVEGAPLQPAGSVPQDWVCSAVSMSADTLLVGAPHTNVGVSYEAGAVYVYVRHGTEWTQQATLNAPLSTPGGHFGSEVAIKGNTAVVSSISDFGGAVDVYKRTGTTWAWQTTLDPEAPANSSQGFGYAIALSDSQDHIVVTAPLGSATDPYRGAAYAFELEGTQWVRTLELHASPPMPPIQTDMFGWDATFAGSRFAIGAPQDGTGGAVYIGSPSETVFANGYDP